MMILQSTCYKNVFKTADFLISVAAEIEIKISNQIRSPPFCDKVVDKGNYM